MNDSVLKLLVCVGLCFSSAPFAGALLPDGRLSPAVVVPRCLAVSVAVRSPQSADCAMVLLDAPAGLPSPICRNNPMTWTDPRGLTIVIVLAEPTKWLLSESGTGRAPIYQSAAGEGDYYHEAYLVSLAQQAQAKARGTEEVVVVFGGDVNRLRERLKKVRDISRIVFRGHGGQGGVRLTEQDLGYGAVINADTAVGVLANLDYRKSGVTIALQGCNVLRGLEPGAKLTGEDVKLLRRMTAAVGSNLRAIHATRGIIASVLIPGESKESLPRMALRMDLGEYIAFQVVADDSGERKLRPVDFRYGVDERRQVTRIVEEVEASWPMTESDRIPYTGASRGRRIEWVPVKEDGK
jgi:hypothetical protein